MHTGIAQSIHEFLILSNEISGTSFTADRHINRVEFSIKLKIKITFYTISSD